MWHDPGPVEVAPGVHRVPLPLPGDGLKAVNTYLLEDEDGWTLVDAGWDARDSREALERAAALVGVDLRHLRRLLVTHIHFDHLGGAHGLRRDSGLELCIGDGERLSYTEITTSLAAREAERARILLGAGAGDLSDELRRTRGDQLTTPLPWQPPDAWLRDGDVVGSQRRLRALATPGHTAGHLCFLDEGRRLLLSGDHVLPHITPSIGFEARLRPTALADFLSSLARVRDLDVDLVLPAHGDVFTDLPGRVDALAAHHEVRLGACAAALSPAGSTVLDVARRIGWTRREHSYDELDLFNRWLAIWETLAHLELLEARGAVGRTGGADGPWRFARAAGPP